MLRIAVCLMLLVFISGCEKNWRGLMIEKRVYRDGYYVHLPWKRNTPQYEYPKPQPYPVDHSRNAPTDTSEKYARRVPSDSTRTQPVPGPAGGTYGGGAGPTAPPAIGGNGFPSPNPSPPSAGGGFPSPPSTTSASPIAAPASPPVAYAPPPQLTPEPVNDPPLYDPRPTYYDSLQPDSAVAANDSIASDSTLADKGFEFPEGEFSLFAEAGFYIPSGNGIKTNPQSYNIGGGARYTIHPWGRHKISGEVGAFVSNIKINQQQRRQWPLYSEPHDKERIIQWKLRYMFMDHIYVTRNASAKVDAVEIGFFHELGFFSTHVAINNSGADKDVMFTRDKTRQFGLKYLRHSQLGCTLRIANDMWSVFMNYRFNPLIKGNHGGDDLPKMVVGVSWNYN